MLDIKWYREQPDLIRDNMKKRGLSTDDVERVIELDRKWRDTLQANDALKHQRNVVTQEIAQMKKANKDASAKINETRKINETIKENDGKIESYLSERDALRMETPNIMHPAVPVGKDASENAELRKWGKLPKQKFEPKSHQDVLTAINCADFESAAEASGRGFYYLLGDIALLDIALQRFAIDHLIKRGYTFVVPPIILNHKAMQGMVNIADFQNVLYKLENEDLYLIATSEHSLGAMHMDKTFNESELPLRYAGLSPCFRKEIGAHGVDTRGIFRVHQFYKIEQFVFDTPDHSWEEHERMVKVAEEIFQKLELPYVVKEICTGDLGKIAARKYDIEAWMAKQGEYKEVVSCSNCTEYQATRLGIKYKRKDGTKDWAHTLNSTAIATSRAIVAIVENNQQKDGTVKVPKALVKYMNGKKVMGK